MGKRFWRLLAQYDSETTDYTACAGVPASPYSPDIGGRLVGLRAVVNRSAATSLINHVQFRLTATSFTPNSIEVGAQGSGLQTAPAQQPESSDWQVDQPVVPSLPIAIEARNVTADTPVSVSVLLYGLFEAA